jgi:nicotinamide riboside transporter PnuC
MELILQQLVPGLILGALMVVYGMTELLARSTAFIKAWFSRRGQVTQFLLKLVATILLTVILFSLAFMAARAQL